MMDKEHADFERVFEDVKAHLTPKVVPVEIPIGDGHDFHGIINLFSGHCHFYKKGTKTGEYDVVPIPAEYQGRFQQYTDQFTEAVAATDDALIERYLGGEEIPREEFVQAVKKGMLAGRSGPALLRQPGADLWHADAAEENGGAFPVARRRCRSRRWRRQPARRSWAGCSRPCPSPTWAT